MYKRFIFSLIIAIVSGALLGHTLFEKFKEEEQTVFNDMSPIYFLREGVYDNLEYALASANKFATKIKSEEYFFDTNNIMLNLLVKFPLLKDNNLDNNSINFQALDYKVKILRESLNQQNSFNFTYTLKK